MPIFPKASILNIKPYVAGKSKIKGRIIPVVKLSSNESALGPSPNAKEAYMNALECMCRYPDGTALSLREAIAEIYHLDVNRIVCGAGSDELISLLIQAYTEPGDEVLYSQYGFLMYGISARAVGAVPVTAFESHYRTDIEAILEAVTERTKLVFIANPNNPTGSYITKDELDSLRKRLPENILLVIDGAYGEFADEPDYTAGEELAESTPNTVMLRTFSKIYGLASLRLGWAYGPAEVIDVLNRVRGPFNVSTPALVAGEAAVRDVAFLSKAKEHNNYWLSWLYTSLKAMGLDVYPSIGNFLMVGFKENVKHNALKANDFLQDRGIIVRDIASYGLGNHLRITIGLSEENKSVVEVLSHFLDV